MKKGMYWFLSDTAGRALTAWWKWYWGQSVSAGNTVTLEVARESFATMQASGQNLTESASKVAAVYGQASQKHQKHRNQYKEANEQAALALKEGNEAAARLAVARAIPLEKALPNLTQMVDQSQNLLKQAKQDPQLEQEKLEACRLEMGNLQAIAEMSEVLTQVMKLTGNLGIDSARLQFDQAETAIKYRNLQVIAPKELSQSRTKALKHELETLTQSDAIEKQLNVIRHHQSNNLNVIKDQPNNDAV